MKRLRQTFFSSSEITSAPLTTPLTQMSFYARAGGQSKRTSSSSKSNKSARKTPPPPSRPLQSLLPFTTSSSPQSSPQNIYCLSQLSDVLPPDSNSQSLLPQTQQYAVPQQQSNPLQNQQWILASMEATRSLRQEEAPARSMYGGIATEPAPTYYPQPHTQQRPPPEQCQQYQHPAREGNVSPLVRERGFSDDI